MSIFRYTGFLAILQKSLLTILAVVLVWAPVWQSVHALTHTEIPAVPNAGNPDTYLVQADTGSDSDTDSDEACPDCLSFTAAKTCLPDSTCYLFDSTTRHCWFSSCLVTNGIRFFSPYLTRAPPVPLI